MANEKETSKEEAAEKSQSTDTPEQRGKKAIEADKKFSKPEKDDKQKDDEEKKDAEKWRNEG